MIIPHPAAEPARPLGLPIHLRAYAIAPDQKPARATSIGPSEWTLVFDTETTTDHAQALRFGTYQWRRHEQLIEAGLFYRPEGLTLEECELLADYARRLHLHTEPEPVLAAAARAAHLLAYQPDELRGSRPAAHRQDRSQPWPTQPRAARLLR